ncbi:MAG TPA: oxidoreductase [Aldersonia sp.]
MAAAEQKPVRVALIGYGFVGKTFHAPLITATPGMELTCVVSSRPDAVHADLPDVAVVDDQQAAQGVDLVVVAAPNAMHAPLAADAMRAGRHVVVDKPFTLDVDEARSLRALAAQHDRLLSVFHNRRWDSDFLGVEQVIESGRLGEVVQFESHFDRFRPEVRDRWRERSEPGGGLWFDLGPHLIDQALQLFGLPQSVTAGIAVLRPGGSADDWAHVLLSYEHLRVILHASMVTAGGTARFTVHGTSGSLVKQHLDPQEDQLKAGMRPRDPGWGVDDDPFVLYLGDGSREELPAPIGDQGRYYAGIRDAVLGIAPTPVTSAQALAVMAVVEAGLVSAHEGRSVELELTDDERDAFAEA